MTSTFRASVTSIAGRTHRTKAGCVPHSITTSMPYTYFGENEVRKMGSLRRASTSSCGRTAAAVGQGAPTSGTPIPYKRTAEYPAHWLSRFHGRYARRARRGRPQDAARVRAAGRHDHYRRQYVGDLPELQPDARTAHDQRTGPGESRYATAWRHCRYEESDRLRLQGQPAADLLQRRHIARRRRANDG